MRIIQKLTMRRRATYRRVWRHFEAQGVNHQLMCCVVYATYRCIFFIISNDMIAVALLLVKLYKDFVVGVPVAAWLACAGCLHTNAIDLHREIRHRQAMPLRVEYAPLLKQ